MGTFGCPFCEEKTVYLVIDDDYNFFQVSELTDELKDGTYDIFCFNHVHDSYQYYADGEFHLVERE